MIECTGERGRAADGHGVGDVADGGCCEIKEEFLEVKDGGILGMLDEYFMGFDVGVWEDIGNKEVNIVTAEKLEAGFALGFPQRTRGIDDAVAEKVP